MGRYGPSAARQAAPGAVALCLGLGLALCPARADDDSDLARALSNPVADLVSVPIQGNYDSGIGPLGEGDRLYFNIQPVIPVSITPDVNMISRTILPIVSQDEVFPLAGGQTGIGDITQSLFFSPVRPTGSGIIWGVGPVFLLPTGSDELLSSEKWGAGPTGVMLRQSGPWTIGVLANHIWSFAGEAERADVSASFVQPFVSYTTPDLWTFTLNTESTYNWETAQWSVPLNFTAAKLVTFGQQRVSLFAGVRYWADTPQASGPADIGFRFGMTFLFPRN